MGDRGKQKKRWHTFAICAYGESPYLESCIRSVKNQTVPSDVVLATSTPCPYIEGLCRKYGVPYFINTGGAGITQDWNYAYAKAETPIVTIAHQDDIYFKQYTEQMLRMCKKASKPLIFFSDYYEIRDRRMVRRSLLLGIKRLMLLPLRPATLQGSRWVRRRILSLGSPICCPSVAFFRENLPETVFRNHFQTNEDWEAWERISRRKGQFLYCKEALVAHRIHEGSATSFAIREDGGRTREDMEMYRKFWPEWVAGILCGCYKKSEGLNGV